MKGELPPFDDMATGKNCPLCQTRPDVNEFSFKISDLSVSTLYLERNQTYAGYCVLIFKARHVTGIEHLTADEYHDFMQDLRKASRAVLETVKPDHMNYATLGNSIPHIHYHIIPRRKNDPRWGEPIWTSRAEETQKSFLREDEYLAQAAKIRKALGD